MKKRAIEMPVMAARCASCPFNEDGDAELRARVIGRLMRVSQICHHPAFKGKEQTHLCRGARDLQLMIMFRLGVISAPTDEAWMEAAKARGLI